MYRNLGKVLKRKEMSKTLFFRRNKLMLWFSLNQMFILLAIICIGVVSCKDIFVDDISDETVNIVSPKNNAILYQSQIPLVWEKVENADNYHIIIVSPSFDHIESYVCDSITTDYKMKINLDEGNYEWTVQAFNSAYFSPKSFGMFKIIKP